MASVHHAWSSLQFGASEGGVTAGSPGQLYFAFTAGYIPFFFFFLKIFAALEKSKQTLQYNIVST